MMMLKMWSDFTESHFPVSPLRPLSDALGKIICTSNFHHSILGQEAMAYPSDMEEHRKVTSRMPTHVLMARFRDVDEVFDRANDIVHNNVMPQVTGCGMEAEDMVITVSHFAPRRDCMPAQESLYFKALPFVAGSPSIERMIRKYDSRIHVFGHTHINWDRVLSGVRYVNWPLKYPKERDKWETLGYQGPDFAPKCIWES